MATNNLPHSEVQLQKLKVCDLKTLCRGKGLSVSGNKAALIQRLLHVDKNTQSGNSGQSQAALTSAAAAAPSPPPAVTTTQDAPTSTSENTDKVGIIQLTESPLPAESRSASAFDINPVSVAQTLPPVIVNILSSHLAKASVPASTTIKRKLQAIQTEHPIARLPKKPVFQTLVPNKPNPTLNVTTTPAFDAVPSASNLAYFARNYGWIVPVLGHKDLTGLVPCHASLNPESLHAVLSYLTTKAYCILGNEETLLIEQQGTTMSASVIQVERVSGDVYAVKLADTTQHTFLAASGEILSIGAETRPDWAAYLATAGKEAEVTRTTPLISLVRSNDEESFLNGISKLFRSKLAAMPDRVAASCLLGIAECYVLAHIAPNAVSGSWHSIAQQQAEFAGITPADGTRRNAKLSLKVALFLPEMHQVESVSIAGRLHQSIAVVQTTHRAQFVLRITGQVIGETEEGVLPLFRDLLKCDGNGRV